MTSSSSSSTFLTLNLLLLIFALFTLHVQPKVTIIPEDGYTITTILDGHKLQINPYSLLQRPTSSDLILLDSANSTFYTVQLPISKESVFRRFSGNGSPGYADGDLDSAQFDKPRSFAIDIRGNVYVADRFNRTIRKISTNGVTTIAGGSSEKSFRKDGPAQNASFSYDFELAFIPSMCALLVSDHMHQLVHQINLKEEDCTHGSKSGLGAGMIWSLGLGLSCLLGLVIGFVVRPYIFPHEGSSPCRLIATWKHCLTSLGKLVVRILYSGIKSAVASCSWSSVLMIVVRLWRLIVSYFLLMLRIIIGSPRPYLESVSLLDLDALNSGEVTKSSKYFDQLKDLMSFDEDIMDSSKETLNQGNDTRGRRVVYHGDSVMMQQPKMRFQVVAKDSSSIPHQESPLCNLGTVKRR